MTPAGLGGHRPPGMADVARRAGVSHQTVSRVLNDPDKVKPATRERVRRAIAELGYRPNVAARALVTRRSGTIGVVIPATNLFGPTSTLLSLENAARDEGYWISLASLPTPDRRAMSATLEHFIDQGVDAIAVIAPTEDALRAVPDTAHALPVVAVTSADVSGLGLTAVSVDQRAGARLATRHLLELGHRRHAHIAGSLDWFDAQERLAGWRDALADAGLEPGSVVRGDWSAESGYRCARELLAVEAGKTGPTAVFAANDQMALGALRAFAEAGIAVPGQVSLVGFDDVPGSSAYHPPLTTLHQDFDALGRRALAALLALLAPGSAASPPTDGGAGTKADGAADWPADGAPGPPPDPETDAPVVPRLVIRSSTGRCPA